MLNYEQSSYKFGEQRGKLSRTRCRLRNPTEKSQKDKRADEFRILKIAVSQWGAVNSIDKVLQGREIYEL